MTSFDSTPKEPIKFFETCFFGSGLSSLKAKFEGNLFLEGYYNKERDVMLVQRYLPLGDERGELLEAETNLREIELSFEDFLVEEFPRQVIVSKRLIREYYRGDKGVAAMFFDTTLLSLYRMLLNKDERESSRILDLLEKSVVSVLNYTYRLFGDIFPESPVLKKVRDYMLVRTGKLRKPLKCIYSPLSLKQLQLIFKMCKSANFIDKGSREEDFFSVFQGKNPVNKLIWTDTLYALYSFIRGIEGKGIHQIGHGKWELVADCFDHYRKGQIFPKQLLNPSPGTRERTEELGNIIAMFNDPV